MLSYSYSYHWLTLRAEKSIYFDDITSVATPYGRQEEHMGQEYHVLTLNVMPSQNSTGCLEVLGFT